MTIIADFGNWHIESHRIVHTDVATATTDVSNFNLDRAGVFLGFANMYTAAPITNSDEVHCQVDHLTNFDVPDIGERITGLRSVVRNTSGANTTVEHLIIVYIRDWRSNA